MSERLGRVTGALQTFQEPNFQRLLFRFATERREQPLKFSAMRQIAALCIRS